MINIACVSEISLCSCSVNFQNQDLHSMVSAIQQLKQYLSKMSLMKTHTHTHGPRFLWQIQDSICMWLILILQNRRWDEAEIKRDVKIYKRKKSSWIWQKALETTSRCKQVWCVPWIFCVSGCTHIMLLLLSKSMPVTCFPVLLSDHLISFICSDWWFSASILHSVTISHTV